MLAMLDPAALMSRCMARLLRASRARPARGGRRPRNQFAERLRSLSPSARLIPYGALVMLGAVLLTPGVVPHGPVCGNQYGTATAAERELFIRTSAAAFALIAGLLLVSALAASAQRRDDRPGRPTLGAAAVLAAVALAAAIQPHGPIARPVQTLMAIDLLAPLATYGAALALPLGLIAIAWHKLTGPARLRAAQIAAWTTLLLILPLIMTFTYLTVTPICLD